MGANRTIAKKILDPQQSVYVYLAERVLPCMRAAVVPGLIVKRIEQRVVEPPEGRVSYYGFGAAALEPRVRTRERPKQTKSQTAKALREAGISNLKLHRRAKVGEDTLRATLCIAA